MDAATIARWRMRSQLVWGPGAGSAAGVVGRLAAAQAQDLLPASWGLAQRAGGTAQPADGTTQRARGTAQCTDGTTQPAGGTAQPAGGLTEVDVRAECDAGAVLRTHVLRPTWHFVAPADARWLLAVTAPRVHRLNEPYYRRWGLDGEARAATRRVLVAELADGRARTRAELGEALARAGFALTGQGLALALMSAELEAAVCSGASRDGRQTYALLDERAPDPGHPVGDEAWAELARRYYASRGPATVHDLAGWASLTLAEARRATAAVADELASSEADDDVLWHAPGDPPARRGSPRVDLVQGLDELVMAYSRTRSVLVGDVTWPSGPAPLGHAVLVDGRLAGRWAYERDARGRPARVRARALRPWTAAEREGVAAAACAFGRFAGGDVTVEPG